MFYKNKETKEIVYLVKSDSSKSIVFTYKDNTSNTGKILDYNKKEFKKHYIKFKKCTFTPPEEGIQQVIINDYIKNKEAYCTDMENYIENKKLEERQKNLERQSEADRVRMLKELADG